MKPPLRLLLARPRGFCAGVDRAIHIVEKAIDHFGAPVYVRHEIVHNAQVVERLRQRGAIFVDELDAIPDGFPVIFSAHGVAKAVVTAAETRQMVYLDATCPLVSKVHREAEHHANAGRFLILVGHKGHPEVEGTMGQLPLGSVALVESVADAQSFTPPSPEQPLAYVTQTTLSVDETADILDILRQRFPHIHEPKRGDICYATTNRQQAVRDIAPQVTRMLVVGSPNSSNAQRLVEVARDHGCPEARLIDTAHDLDEAWLNHVENLGLTAGASTPEDLVQEVIDALRERFTVTVEEVSVAEETITFNLPRLLVAAP